MQLFIALSRGVQVLVAVLYGRTHRLWILPITLLALLTVVKAATQFAALAVTDWSS